jgi:error-prone DNA polymerase
MPVRLGLNRIAGLSSEAMHRIAAAQPFRDVDDACTRAQLNRTDVQALAEAGALARLAGHRHQAVWQAAAYRPMPEVLHNTRIDEPRLTLPAPSEAENLVADYARLGLTLGRHPMAMIREKLAALGVQPAGTLAHFRHGQLARAAGLVTHRQRPATASGTLFISLEDDTGMINVIVWPDVLKRFYDAVLYSQLMMVWGVWQRDTTLDPQAPGQVRNLLAQRVEDRGDLLHTIVGELPTHSRDFH